MRFQSPFRHPKKVCMTYFQHMKLSLYLSYLLGKGSIAALIHSLIPDLFITSTTDITKKITKILETSGC